MLATQLCEIHDGTVIVRVLAVKIDPASGAELDFLIDKLGFDPGGVDVLLIDLESRTCATDQYDWPRVAVHPRTLPVVHEYLRNHWPVMPAGEIFTLDIEVMVGALDPVWRH